MLEMSLVCFVISFYFTSVLGFVQLLISRQHQNVYIGIWKCLNELWIRENIWEIHIQENNRRLRVRCRGTFFASVWCACVCQEGSLCGPLWPAPGSSSIIALQGQCGPTHPPQHTLLARTHANCRTRTNTRQVNRPAKCVFLGLA